MELTLGALLVVIAGLLVLLAVGLLLRDAILRRREQQTQRLRGKIVKAQPRLAFRKRQRPHTVLGRIVHSLDHLIQDAGIQMLPGNYRALMLLTGTFAAAALLIYFDSLAAAVVGFALGFFVHFPFLSLRRIHQRRKLDEQLPEALNLLARAVRAGESVDQALALVARESPQPVAGVFQMCVRQLQMGLALPDVMRHMARNTQHPDLRLFSTTLMIHRHTGGNLPQTLTRLADVLRTRLDYRRHFRAATAGGRLSTTVIACTALLIVLYLIVWKPDYMQQLLEGPIGWTMLGVAFTLQLLGILWVMALMRTDY